MSESYTLGQRGETLARQHMERLGYQILEQRWKSHHYELDLIAFDPGSGEIVFCEVKTRATDVWGRPEDAIDMGKIRRTVRAAHHYLCLHRVSYPARFDVFAIICPRNGEPTVNHIRDAFYAPL